VRVLVLGGGGQLGHDVVRAAGEVGDEVVGLDRARLDLASIANAATVGTAGAGVVAALGDMDFDALINCAAYTRVDDAESDPAGAFAVNALAVEGLARACAKRGARLVQVSTDYVFDGLSRRPYREDDPPSPINIYGASKLTGEALARRAHPEGTLVVRTASLFGVAGARRAERGVGGNFVETMIRAGTARGELRVVDDVVMSPTATRDVADAILHLLHAGAEPGLYHVVNGGQASWHDFARAILDGAGVGARLEPVPSSEYPTPARRPSYSVLDAGKAVSAGCRLRPWREALEEYLSMRSER
jgi:dTDP-4-dehydrorhamnose reductase